MYSVFGIKSQKDDILLQNGNFKQNGQFHFTINDNIHYVQDNISYSYIPKNEKEQSKTQEKNIETGKNDTQQTTYASDVKTNTPGKVKKSKNSTSNKAKRKNKIIGYSLLGGSLLSGCVSVGCGILSSKYHSDALHLKSSQTRDTYNTLIKKSNITKGCSIATGIISGITIPVSIVFLVKKDSYLAKKKITLNIEHINDKYTLGFISYF